MLAQQDNDTQLLEQMRKINERLYTLERKMDVLADLLKLKSQENKSALIPKVTKPLSPIDFYADESNQHQHNNQQQNSHSHIHQRNYQTNTQQNIHQNNRPSKERVMYSAVCADCRQECSLPFKPRADRPVYCKDCFSRRKNPNAFKTKEEARVEVASQVQSAAIVTREEVKPNKTKKTKAVAKSKKKPVTAKKVSSKKSAAKKPKRK